MFLVSPIIRIPILSPCQHHHAQTTPFLPEWHFHKILKSSVCLVFSSGSLYLLTLLFHSKSKRVWSSSLNQSFFVPFSLSFHQCFSPNLLFPWSFLLCLFVTFDTLFYFSLPPPHPSPKQTSLALSFPHPGDSILPFQRRAGSPIPINPNFFYMFLLFFVSFLPLYNFFFIPMSSPRLPLLPCHRRACPPSRSQSCRDRRPERSRRGETAMGAGRPYRAFWPY